MAQMEAMREGRCGLLVTQLDFSSYTVDVSADVPYGQTLERSEWNR